MHEFALLPAIVHKYISIYTTDLISRYFPEPLLGMHRGVMLLLLYYRQIVVLNYKNRLVFANISVASKLVVSIAQTSLGATLIYGHSRETQINWYAESMKEYQQSNQ